MRSALKQEHRITLGDVVRDFVPACAPFETPEDVMSSSLGTTRPIEVFVPKRGERSLLAHNIEYVRTTLFIPRITKTSESTVMRALRDLSSVQPSHYYDAETLLMALPKLIEGGANGIDSNRQNHFILENATLFTVFKPYHVNYLCGLSRSWREGLAQCADDDYLFFVP